MMKISNFLVFFKQHHGVLFGGGLGAAQRSAHRNEIQTTRQRIDKALDRIEYLHAAASDVPGQKSTSRTDTRSASTDGANGRNDSRSSAESATRRRTRS